MIVGLAEVRELLREISGDVALVVSHSGGKDSMRMLGILQRELPELPIYCVLADTGFMHRTPISPEGGVRIRCESLAHPVPVTMVRNPNKTYLEMVERRGRFPSAQYRQCTSDLKRGPIERFIRSLGCKVVINRMGIRAEESRFRAQLQPWPVNASLTTRTSQDFNWLPIFGESLRDVLEWQWNSGIPLRPVYVQSFIAMEPAEDICGGWDSPCVRGRPSLRSWIPERPPSHRMRCNPASRSEGVGNHIVTIHFMR
jgi:3'-phosphoadenosine 5'-phosphosulfate sulfotransferase (PAPS reductase)/FAD synthetase